jgi:hypothetical protein
VGVWNPGVWVSGTLRGYLPEKRKRPYDLAEERGVAAGKRGANDALRQRFIANPGIALAISPRVA